jgi:hypothetical protein
MEPVLACVLYGVLLMRFEPSLRVLMTHGPINNNEVKKSTKKFILLKKIYIPDSIVSRYNLSRVR